MVTIKVLMSANGISSNLMMPDDMADSKKSSLVSASSTSYDSTLTVVFIIGIEGTGHHFISALLKDSPNMRMLRELGWCKGETPLRGGPQLMKAMASGEHFEQLVKGMKEMDQIFKNHVQEQHLDAPIHVAINANGSCRNRMISYPFNLGRNRVFNYPNIDILYDACKQAEINCKHIYIYRDPYDIIVSTVKKRKFNSDVNEAMRTYTLMLHNIYSQLQRNSDKTALCFGPLDVHGHKRREDWDNFGSIFGWSSPDDFRASVNEKNSKTNPSSLSESEKLELIPTNMRLFMNTFIDIHETVIDLCYSSLSRNTNENIHM